MRVGIVTQPLINNYGGILQNYALQTILKRLGHEVLTIDYCCPSWIQWYDNTWRVLAHTILGHNVSFSETPTERRRIEKPLRRFVKKHIDVTIPRTRFLEKKIIKRYVMDALVVGSDQVWRPCYNAKINQCFLSFAKNMNLKRIAYAASFGTDKWEYTSKQTKECASLARCFDAISVREASGVSLCQEYLGVNATHVLDPTLLLTPDDYCSLCVGLPRKEPFVFAYILDQDEEKLRNIKSFAENMGLSYMIISAGSKVREDDSIELWLSYFRDAAYVITDSFHGTAFSINFKKDFYVYTNEERGNSRFDSLLELFDLKNRIIDNDIIKMEKIDWEIVEQKLALERSKSIDYIKGNMNQGGVNRKLAFVSCIVKRMCA